MNLNRTSSSLFQVLLVVVFGISILASVHEFGHWIGYEIVQVDSSIRWLKTPPDLDGLSDGQNLFGLYFGLLFQLIPGAMAALYLAKVDVDNKVARSVLVASWLIRSVFIVFTFLVVALLSRSSFSGSDGSLGDEWEIQRILAQDIGSSAAWIIAVGTTAFPLMLFVATQWNQRETWVTWNWCVIGVSGWFIIIGILLMTG